MTTISEPMFIKGNTPSLKNSKIKTSRGVFPSKTVGNYLRSLGIQAYSASRKIVLEYKTKPNLFREYLKHFPDLSECDYPVIIKFHFVRKTKAKFDFNNANQIILDLLTAHDIIPDDNMDYVLPIPWQMEGKWYSIDKNNPGVYIQIFKCN